MIMSTWRVRSNPSWKESTSSSRVMSSTSTLRSRTFLVIGAILAASPGNCRSASPGAMDQLLGLPDVAARGGAENDRLQPLKATCPLDRLLGRDGSGGEYRHGDGPALPRSEQVAVG